MVDSEATNVIIWKYTYYGVGVVTIYELNTLQRKQKTIIALELITREASKNLDPP